MLTVTKVNDNGTLELINQTGRTFTRHVEQCAPCVVPNIDGTVHTGLFRPAEKHPCAQGAEIIDSLPKCSCAMGAPQVGTLIAF